MHSVRNEMNIGPKLVPFFKTLAIYFVIFPSSDSPSIFGAVLKCLPIISLMLFILLQGINLGNRYKYSRRILTGLVFCCLGDALLVWPNYFTAGMIAFAIGHVNYIIAFGFKPLNFTVGVIVLALDIAGIIYLFPGIQGIVLSFGVPVYIIILGIMMWRALAQLNSMKVDIKNWNKLCSSLGGTLFVLSDLILGINVFRYKVNYAQTLIMSSYYTAQLGIALSVVDSSHGCEIS
ncbi:lysoplasmalogenase-like protein TMEM86A isoform X3 [Harmonia axyridis]|uniref:lysoplasmalogenase-like protein TMEM86A isoform X3 n=1 Tax=Harmonia axyridis TaxID=115357 RepID=UPI001E277C0F|nr:lysoplasmalogenase-like protein TMEM86A isoform X3 [Harmonia axyridis]